MIPLALSGTARVVFSLDSTPDATPVVTCYAGATLLGTATVNSLGGVRNFEATYALPGSGIADGTVIEFRANADVDSVPMPTLHMVAGVVGYFSSTLSAIGNVNSAEEIATAVWDKATDDHESEGSFGKLLVDLLSKLAGITRLSSWLRAGFRADTADAIAMSEINLGGGTYDPDTDSQEAIAAAVDAIEVSELTGDNNVTVIVKDDDTNALIENARVTIKRPGYSQPKTTNADGELDSAFTVESADWNIRVTANGYVGQNVTRTINDDHEEVFLLTANAASGNEDPDLCDVTVRVINQKGIGIQNARVTASLDAPLSFTTTAATINIDEPFLTDEDGNAVLSLIRSSLLSDDGLYEFKILYKGKEYKFQYTVPDAASATAVQSIS